MKLIPLSRAFGYRYVLVDSEHVEPVEKMGWPELRYRPHLARYGDAEIIVVVRDRELSNVKESGMELDWSCTRSRSARAGGDFAPLVTTATDGENGGWFRTNLTEGANYWSAFYLPMLAHSAPARPTCGRPSLATTCATTCPWRGECRHGCLEHPLAAPGKGFTEWTGFEAQRDTLERYAEISARLHRLGERAAAESPDDAGLGGALEEARRACSRAETSCNIYWGEAWVDRADADLEGALLALEDAEHHCRRAGKSLK